jgi:hypothetical protein
MENPWKIHGKSMENPWKIHGKSFIISLLNFLPHRWLNFPLSRFQWNKIAGNHNDCAGSVFTNLVGDPSLTLVQSATGVHGEYIVYVCLCCFTNNYLSSPVSAMWICLKLKIFLW